MKEETIIHLNVYSEEALNILKSAAERSSIISFNKFKIDSFGEVIYDITTSSSIYARNEKRLSAVEFLKKVKAMIKRFVKNQEDHSFEARYNNNKKLSDGFWQRSLKGACLLDILNEVPEKDIIEGYGKDMYVSLKGERRDPLTASAIEILEKEMNDIINNYNALISDYTRRMMDERQKKLDEINEKLKELKKQNS